VWSAVKPGCSNKKRCGETPAFIIFSLAQDSCWQHNDASVLKTKYPIAPFRIQTFVPAIA